MSEDAPPPPADEAALREKLRGARARLLMRFPFYGYLVSNLEDLVLERPGGTAGTDGRVLTWSAAFLRRLTADDTMFVLAHEALHCALQHLWRRGPRDPHGWNLAADAAVNDMLLESGLRASLSRIQGARGRSAEAVYGDLVALQRANAGKGTLDDHDQWTRGEAADPEQRARRDAWTAALAQAATFGRVPRGLEREVEQVLHPTRDWRDVLREGLFFPEDYQWTPTDRRFPEVLLPTLTGSVHRVVLAIDTSASIEPASLSAFWAELVAILRNNRCEARVLTCDAAVHDEWDETQFDPSLMRKLRGGGGTSFVPVFDKVAEYAALGWTPEAVVYLTDLDGTFPSPAPSVRTLWVVQPADGGKRAPFGEVVVLGER